MKFVHWENGNMSLGHNPSIVTSGLMLCLDAANKRSYPGTGTTWFDLSGNGYNFTLTNSPTYGNHKNTPCFTFSGVDDYATRAGSIAQDIGSACTLTIVMSSINNTNFGGCSRLFSVSDGTTTNNDYSNYFTLASCIESKFGLWYKSNPGGLYPTSELKTANDDYKIVTYKWTAGSNAYVFVNGEQESSAACTTAFNYTQVQRMTVAMNSNLLIENSYVRVASIMMYNVELTAAQIAQNFNAIRGRYGI